MITTIIIVSFNTKDLLRDCLSSIFSNHWQYKFQVAVMDNASSDGSVEMVKKDFPEVILIQNKSNLGFAGGNNTALRKFKSDLYLLLNSDTLLLDGALDSLIDFMGRTDFDIGSGKLLNKDKSLQPNAGDLPLGLPLFFWLSGWDDILPYIKYQLPSFHRKFANFYDSEKEMGWVSGSLMIIKKRVIEKIGVLDEIMFMYGEDVEYCLRAKKAGFKVGWTDRAQVIHLGGASSQNPSFNQWIGEFKGLIYIYNKYFGNLSSIFLRLLIYIFIIIRMLAFLIVGKGKIATTYAKVLFNI